MSNTRAKDAVEVATNFYSRSLIPFTGGLLIFIYAFFWPESYGHWLGTIVRSFLDAAHIGGLSN